MIRNWNEHYSKTKHLAPSAMLIKALTLFDQEQLYLKQAIDLGCGTGTDTLELLKKGWKVISIDKQKEAIEHLQEQTQLAFRANLTLIHKAFESVNLPEVQFINASFSLPFCEPHQFDAFWQRITKAIVSKGRFAGQFFGPNDTWSINEKMLFHTEKQVRNLFDSFEIEFLKEVEIEGKTLGGRKKHWHIFHVVAKKT